MAQNATYHSEKKTNKVRFVIANILKLMDVSNLRSPRLGAMLNVKNAYKLIAISIQYDSGDRWYSDEKEKT